MAKPDKSNLSHRTPTPQASVKHEGKHEKEQKDGSQMSHMKQLK